MKLTAIILARNEEKFIGACIRSVRGFADEVLVIDDGSTDQTAQLSQSLGARVVQHALNGDWGAQQTFAIGQASSDWIFFIDADERTTPELAAHIKRIVAADDQSKAYACARLSYFWGRQLKHGGWYPDYVVRLLPRAGTFVTGFVHPKIHHKCVEVRLPRDAYLVHYPYRDWDHYFNKLNFYTTLAARKAKAEGKSASIADIILHPVWASFRMLILRGGFLDGKIGFILAAFHFFYTMAKYVKLYYLDRENTHVTERMNILVSALVNLGDVVLTTSAIALLKNFFPNAKITMLVKPVVKDAVENNPVIDNVLVLDYRAKQNSISTMLSTVKEIKRRDFDLFISFDRKTRGALLAWLARIPVRIGPSKVFDDNRSRVTMLFTDVVSIEHDLDRTLQADTYQTIVRNYFSIDGRETPKFARITEESRANVDRLFDRLHDARLKIALCVKGTFELKTYPKDYFAQIVKTLRAELDAAFFVVGAPNDRDYAEEVIRSIETSGSIGSNASIGSRIENFCGETSLIDLAEIFNRVDLFLTVDTGAAHIAATTSVPMVVMFGCTPVERWHPINPNAIALSSNETCCPCSIKPEQCPSHPKPNCLWNVKPERVLDACRRLLSERSSREQSSRGERSRGESS